MDPVVAGRSPGSDAGGPDADDDFELQRSNCSELRSSCSGGRREFYGASWGGGTTGDGTIYQILPSGAITVLYSFCPARPCIDGLAANGGLIGLGQNFYGTTAAGGDQAQGTLFQVTPQGSVTTLVRFSHMRGSTEGAVPYSGLALGPNGILYGTTGYGGTYGKGTIFSFTPGSPPVTLHSFCARSGCPDGETPARAVTVARNGDLWGVTPSGEAAGSGTIVRLSASGKFTTLFSFCSDGSCSGSVYPNGLFQASDGNFLRDNPARRCERRRSALQNYAGGNT